MGASKLTRASAEERVVDRTLRSEAENEEPQMQRELVCELMSVEYCCSRKTSPLNAALGQRRRACHIGACWKLRIRLT
jgi:hypothetical protein